VRRAEQVHLYGDWSEGKAGNQCFQHAIALKTHGTTMNRIPAAYDSMPGLEGAPLMTRSAHLKPRDFEDQASQAGDKTVDVGRTLSTLCKGARIKSACNERES
jgi:hypothetical protein